MQYVTIVFGSFPRVSLMEWIVRSPIMTTTYCNVSKFSDRHVRVNSVDQGLYCLPFGQIPLQQIYIVQYMY